MKTVLAIKTRRLGDTVLWTSSLQALLDLGCEVEIVYPKAYQALFRHDPRFPVQYFIEDGSPPTRTYEAVLNFHASPSSAKYAKRVKGHVHIIHSHSRIPKLFGSTTAIPNLGVPMKATERDLNVVRALGWSGDAPTTKLFFTGKSRLLKKEKPWLLLGTESSRPSKEWPLEYYAQLARLLSDRYSIGFFAENVQRVNNDPRYIELSKHAIHLATPTLDDVLADMSGASYFVGGDSGLKHVAVALGVRTLTLFGPESIGEWHCYENHLALQIPVSCRTEDPEPSGFEWCAAEHCPLASHACLRLIRPEDVVKVL